MRQISVPGRPAPTMFIMLNLATEASAELWRRKTAVVIPKLLIKGDTKATKGRRTSKLDMETIIQEGANLMPMKDRQKLSMGSCSILGGNNFHSSRQFLRVIVEHWFFFPWYVGIFASAILPDIRKKIL